MDCALYDKASGHTPYRFYYLSVDGGQIWRSWRMTGAVDFVNIDLGWRLATDPVAGYELEQSRDGGLTWTVVKRVAWEGQLDFVSQQAGWVLARLDDASALLRTADGGVTWTEIKPQAAP